MERGRKMDAPGAASNSVPLIPLSSDFLFCLLRRSSAQTNSSDSNCRNAPRSFSPNSAGRKLLTWVESAQHPSADFDFYYGTALAQLGRLADAQQAFAAGARMQPRDKRFPLELAGVAFKQKDTPQAARYLRRALRLDPHDAYGNDFLGTVYFLQGNIEAALKYWNRVNKPLSRKCNPSRPRKWTRIARPRLYVCTGQFLQLPDLLTSEVRTGGLGIFPSQQFDLQARDDGKFDVLFRNRERDGWGQTKLEKLFLLFRGLPFLSITPEYYNLRAAGDQFHFHVSLGCGEAPAFRGTLRPVQGESEIPLRIARRLAQRKLGYPALVSGSGAAVGQFEYAAGSRGRRAFRLSRAAAGTGLRERKFRIAISAA